MGLLDGKKKEEERVENVLNQAAQMAANATDDPSYLNEFISEGSEIPTTAKAASYLSITNAMSEAVTQGKAEEGVFFNSGNQKVYGPEIRVIPVSFKSVWDEKDAAGKTVNRYEPNTIEVTKIPVPPGKKGYPKLINPLTGNFVLETFAYALVLADDPDAGYVFLTAGAGSIAVFRRWNTRLDNVILPNGKKGKMFLKVWRLIASSKISTTTNKPFFGLSDVIDEGWVKQELLQEFVLPARTEAPVLLLTATEDVVHTAEGAE